MTIFGTYSNGTEVSGNKRFSFSSGNLIISSHNDFWSDYSSYNSEVILGLTLNIGLECCSCIHN